MDREGHAVGLAEGTVEGLSGLRDGSGTSGATCRSLLAGRVAALTTVTVAVLAVRPPIGLVAGMSLLAGALGWAEVAAVRARRSSSSVAGHQLTA